MKRFVLFIAAVSFCVALNAQKTINDPNAQKRAVSGFHGVAVSGSFELFLSQGSEESVVISADDPKVRDKIVTEVKDGILHIYLENENKFHVDISLHSKKMRAYVSVKDIDYLSNAGSGKTHVDGKLKSEKLEINIAGSGNVDAGLDVKQLSLSVSGSANADLAGNAENSDLHISGSGNIRNYEFSTSYCKASISGSGNVRITVTKELSAHISGSGNVCIKGDGLIKDYSASGSGKFKRVD